MRNDKNNIINRKKDVILALLFVLILMFSCVTNVFAIDPEEETTEIQVTEQTEPQSSNEPTTEATQAPTEAATEPTTEPTTEATEPTTEPTTEATESTTEEIVEVTEATTEGNPWDFEVPTEGTIEAEQTKADYFTGTVMWSAVGGGLLILLIMFIGKRKY